MSDAGLKARVEPLPGADPYDAAVRPDSKDAVVDIVPPIQSGQSALRPMGTEAILYVEVE